MNTQFVITDRWHVTKSQHSNLFGTGYVIIDKMGKHRTVIFAASEDYICPDTPVNFR